MKVIYNFFKSSHTIKNLKQEIVELTKENERLQEENRIRPISAESFALALLGAIQHRAFRRHILHDQTMTNSDDAFVSSVVDLFWRGISQGESI